MLAKYEQLNSDLPRETRRQLAIFVLAPRVGVQALEELFDRPLGQTPTRHRSWLWYNAIRLSGLHPYWDEFVGTYNTLGCLRCALVRLRRRATFDEWALLSRRLGVSLKRKKCCTLSPHWWHHSNHKPTKKLWTPGGVWDRTSNLTRVLVLGESLKRDHSFSTVTRKLTPEDARRLERELHGLALHETMLAPEAIKHARAYTRKRIAQLVSYSRKTISDRTVSWFFQTRIPVEGGKWVDFTQDTTFPFRIRRYGRTLSADWLPAKD